MSEKIRFKIKVRAMKAAQAWIASHYKNLAEGSVKILTVSEITDSFEEEVKVELTFKVIIGDYFHKGKRSHIGKSYSITLYVNERGNVSRNDNPVIGEEEEL